MNFDLFRGSYQEIRILQTALDIAFSTGNYVLPSAAYCTAGVM
jgi:hypothetical protein